MQAVLDKPGYYRFDSTHWYWFFEIDCNGQVYQMNPRTRERDGKLSNDGWNESAQNGVVTKVNLDEVRA